MEILSVNYPAIVIADMRNGKVPPVAITVGCGVGFAASVGLRRHMVSAKRPAAFRIESGCQLVSLLTMGLVIGIWR